MQTRLENGELRGVIIGRTPVIDSPIMYLQTNRRHYAVIRMMYYGEATEGQLLYKGGPAPTSSEHLDFKRSYWQGRQPLKVFQTSSGEALQDNLVDDSYMTHWNAAKGFTEWVVLDVGDVRWINSITVQSGGNFTLDGGGVCRECSPKNCLLQASLTNGAGPYTTGSSLPFRLRFKYKYLPHSSACISSSYSIVSER